MHRPGTCATCGAICWMHRVRKISGLSVDDLVNGLSASPAAWGAWITAPGAIPAPARCSSSPGLILVCEFWDDETVHCGRQKGPVC